jgi:hypothetical protein
MGKPIFPELEAPPVLDEKVIDIVATQAADTVAPAEKPRGRPKQIAKQGAVSKRRRAKGEGPVVKEPLHGVSRRPGRPPGAKDNTVLTAMLERAKQAKLMKRQLEQQNTPP